MKKEKSKKRKIRFRGLVVILLVGYLIFVSIYYVWKRPIKNVEITGNYYLKDNYLIDYLDVQDKSVFKVSNKSIKNKLLELDLISKVTVKKNIFGSLSIEITEDKILFYDWNSEKIILSSGKEVDYNSNYLGLPSLINFVPSDIYDELVLKLKDIDREVLSLVSEIEYNPSVVNDKIVDENRFLFRMNDGNIVYINTINIDKFNNYLDIYEVIVNKNGNITGCLYLDSNSDNKYFNNCETNPVVETGEIENNGEN